MKYQCDKCKKTKEIFNATICIIDNELKTKEAKCECGEYMKQIIDEEYKGFPTIVRNENNNH